MIIIVQRVIFSSFGSVLARSWRKFDAQPLIKRGFIKKPGNPFLPIQNFPKTSVWSMSTSASGEGAEVTPLSEESANTQEEKMEVENVTKSVNGEATEIDNQKGILKGVRECKVSGNDLISGTPGEKVRIISEGKAQIPQSSNIFYNPTQEFNRDISILAIQTFIAHEKMNDVTILEAMSASGIRAIRYSKEITGVKTVIANDFSLSAVEAIRRNAERNGVENIVQPSFGDASSKMYEARNTAIIVDLDPYGTPTPYLDAAVQCVKEDGLLLVTATDMAVLAGGNHGESCFAKYGSMSLKTKACHELALRIVIYTVQSTANRYGRVAIPLLSLSVDFYVRLFFRIIKSPKKAKLSVLNTSMIYQCTGCKSITLQPLAVTKKNHTTFAQGPPVPKKCEHCDSSQHIAGPVWSGPIHDHEFVDSMIGQINQNFSYLGTFSRIKGMLGLVREELLNSPFYYDVQGLCSVVKTSSIPMNKIRSAIMNHGYQVSLTHAGPNTIKTNIPNNLLWDILRAWRHETNTKPIQEDTIGYRILAKTSTLEKVDFTIRPDATPLSQCMNLLRYQTNPLPFWGPGCRDNFKSHGDGGPSKKQLNQGKKKAKNKNSEKANK